MQSLLFIYNAKSGTINTLFNIGHKLFSPETYACNLCTLTHTIFSEDKTWNAFKIETHINMKFYHIDEFLKLHPDTSYSYPIVLNEVNGKLNPFLTTSEINEITTTKELIALIKQKLY